METIKETGGDMPAAPSPRQPVARNPFEPSFNAEQDALIVSIGDKYLDQPTGRVKWGLARAENPTEFDSLLTPEDSGSLRRIIGRYGYLRRKSEGAPEATPALTRRTVRKELVTSQNRWTERELTAYFEDIVPFVHGDSVDFQGFFRTRTGKMLLAHHEKTSTVSSRFYYEKSKGRSSRLWGKIPGLGSPSTSRRSVAQVSPQPETRTEEAAQATVLTESAVHYCPYCGHDLQPIMRADKSVRER